MITTDEYIDYDRRADEIFELINNGMTRDQVAKKFNYENIRSMDQLMRRRGYRVVKNKYVKAGKEKPSICKLPLRTEKLMDALKNPLRMELRFQRQILTDGDLKIGNSSTII